MCTICHQLCYALLSSSAPARRLINLRSLQSRASCHACTFTITFTQPHPVIRSHPTAVAITTNRLRSVDDDDDDNLGIRFAQLLEEELKVRIVDGWQHTADHRVGGTAVAMMMDVAVTAVLATVLAAGVGGGVFVLLLERGQDVADLRNDLLHSGV